jgi:hypothetical protein
MNNIIEREVKAVSIAQAAWREQGNLLAKNVAEVSKCMLHEYVIVMSVNLRIIVGVDVCWHCGDDLSQLRSKKQHIMSVWPW